MPPVHGKIPVSNRPAAMRVRVDDEIARACHAIAHRTARGVAKPKPIDTNDLATLVGR